MALVHTFTRSPEQLRHCTRAKEDDTLPAEQANEGLDVGGLPTLQRRRERCIIEICFKLSESGTGDVRFPVMQEMSIEARAPERSRKHSVAEHSVDDTMGNLVVVDIRARLLVAVFEYLTY